MGGEPGGEAPQFRPQRSRGGPGGLPPGLGHIVQGGSGGLAPRFRPQRPGGVGGLAPGLGHSVRGGVITHLVTFSVVFCCICGISCLIYPTQNPPFSQQIPLACWLVFMGFIVILGNDFRKFKVFLRIFIVYRPIFTPPKTPVFPTGPASLLVVFRGFPPDIIDTTAYNRVFCSDFDGFSLQKSMRLYSLHLPPYLLP